jgi:hypothetical protein
MNEPRKPGYWWAAAFLLPLLSVGIGVLAGLAAPRRESDWFGGSVFFPILIGGLIGCIASCAAAIISLLRRERSSAVSLFAAIPAAGLLLYSAVAFARGRSEQQRQAALSILSHKNDDEKMARIASWKAKFGEHPDLIVSDDVWLQRTESKTEAEFGLNWLLQEKTFSVTPELKAFVIKNSPRNASLVFTNGRSTHEELKMLCHDKAVAYEVREQAIDCLMRDESYKLTAEEKQMVFAEFATKYTLLFGTKQFTRAELEEMARDPKFPDYIRRDAQQYLTWKSYKEGDR